MKNPWLYYDSWKTNKPEEKELPCCGQCNIKCPGKKNCPEYKSLLEDLEEEELEYQLAREGLI